MNEEKKRARCIQFLEEDDPKKEVKKNEIDKLPKQKSAEILLAAAKAALSTIPVAGGAAAELLGLVIAPRLNKRRDEWLETLAEKIAELEGKVENFKIENLSNNETFITTFTYALTIAVRNHQKEKIEALRNAVLNTALITSTEEEDLHLMFLNFVDAFTPWHLRILMFYDNPREYCQRNGVNVSDLHMGPPSSVLERAFPDLSRDFYNQVTKDLNDRGLAFDVNSLHVMTNEGGMFAQRTTPMGKNFIKFISAPTT